MEPSGYSAASVRRTTGPKAMGQWLDAIIVLAIVGISAGLAVAHLRPRVQARARVLRDGQSEMTRSHFYRSAQR